jgi:endogenous inhibitor of DNA gyrase (YacG/DUF329 family)
MRDQPDPAKSPAPPSPRAAAGYTCSICGTRVPALVAGEAGRSDAAVKAATAHRYRPFCSSRCQRIDLGNWLDERYVVPGPPATSAEPGKADGSDDERA